MTKITEEMVRSYFPQLSEINIRNMQKRQLKSGWKHLKTAHGKI